MGCLDTKGWKASLKSSQRKDVEFCRTYARSYRHLVVDGERMSLVATLAEMLDGREAVIESMRDKKGVSELTAEIKRAVRERVRKGNVLVPFLGVHYFFANDSRVEIVVPYARKDIVKPHESEIRAGVKDVLPDAKISFSLKI
jgi:hypothetical protein